MSPNHASGTPEPESYPEAFERIEAAVDAGRTDLSSLGFWGLLARVKRDAALSVHWAEQAGRIDRKAFEARVRLRVPVWLGNLLLVAAIAAGAGAVGVAIATDDEVVAGLAVVFAGLNWSASFHAPAHWLVGRLVGIRFVAYYLHSLLGIPIPGLKLDYATYLRTPPAARAWMHASGAIASKVGPFLALALWPATEAPAWAAWVVGGYGLLIVGTDVFISTRKSDWKRFRRELRIARVSPG